MSYGATPGVDRLNTIAVDYDSFGRRREDGVRVSTRAIACAIVVACAAALGAHEVGRSTGTRAGLGLCLCECRCDSNGSGERAPAPALEVVRGVVANMPKTMLDQEVRDPMRCGALAAERNYLSLIHI